MYNPLNALLALSLFACSHTGRVSELTERGDCDAALENIDWEEAQVTFVENTAQAGGTAASYTATGAGYIVDAFVFVGEGALKSIVYCPYMAVTVAMATVADVRRVNVNPFICSKGFKVEGSNFGSKIYKNTTSFRTADFDRISRMNRDVATCYVRKSDQNGKTIAKQRLQNLVNDEEFLKKLSSGEKANLLADFQSF